MFSFATNSGAQKLPFQRWHRFKEAFTPELVEKAISSCPITVERCIDPFGGSGTTGLACQFLGVHPILAEVNPYLADLIESKLAAYPSTAVLASDLQTVIELAADTTDDSLLDRFGSLPPTFIEPGHKDRWVFDEHVAKSISALLIAIESLSNPSHQILFKALLGGVLVEVSNVLVNGKGRRYRRRWSSRSIPTTRVLELFSYATTAAINDINRFSSRCVTSYEIIRGDSRSSLRDIAPCELAVFSPPYPNSFDYTDVYNLELWMLGYLTGRESNSRLRYATLSSHVQISRDFSDPPDGSIQLYEIITQLKSRRAQLWNSGIPEMIGAYFSDLMVVLKQLQSVLVDNGIAWIIVGDSRYAGIQVPVASILGDLAESQGWNCLRVDPVRTIRTSAQQGGERKLVEQVLILENGCAIRSETGDSHPG